MRILNYAVERKEWAVISCNRIIITYDEETSAGSGVTRLCRRENDLFTFGIFLEPEIVGPHRAKTFAKCLLDLPIKTLADTSTLCGV